ncbi:MAG: hypothetical protein FWE25_01035 [Lachnospiraceae bacterium]|nr:hypothetical protein [Lachnospiraceae bacterium]
MKPGKIMRQTAPFLILKAIFTALPMFVWGGAFLWFVFVASDIIRLIMPDDVSVVAWHIMFDNIYERFPYALDMAVDLRAPFLILILFPIIYAIVGRIPRYLVRVGHIAVLTHVIINGKAPEKQLSYGFGQVRRNFGKATAFFFLDRLIYQAVSQLSLHLRRMLVGLGPAAFFINRFKSKFIKYVDECILAYTFVFPDTGSFKSSLQGFQVYMRNWSAMAKAAVWTSLLVWFITFIFNIATLALIVWGVMMGEPLLVIVGFLVYVFFGTLKKCFLDSLAMIRMLNVFLSSANEAQELVVGDLMQYSSMSPGFRQLVMAADQQEKIFSPEDKETIFAARPTTFFGRHRNNNWH